MKPLNITGLKMNDTLTWMIDLLLFCIFFILLFGFIKMFAELITTMIMPKVKPEPSDLRFMLISYLGIPFAFWLFVGMGLGFGLAFSGIRLVTVNCDSHNKVEFNKPKK